MFVVVFVWCHDQSGGQFSVELLDSVVNCCRYCSGDKYVRIHYEQYRAVEFRHICGDVIGLNGSNAV